MTISRCFQIILGKLVTIIPKPELRIKGIWEGIPLLSRPSKTFGNSTTLPKKNRFHRLEDFKALLESLAHGLFTYEVTINLEIYHTLLDLLEVFYFLVCTMGFITMNNHHLGEDVWNLFQGSLERILLHMELGSVEVNGNSTTSPGKTLAVLGGSSISKWLVTPIYKPFRPFGRGITLLRGLTNHSY